MTDAVTKGLAELQAALDQLPAKIEANIMRGAMRAGAKVIAKQAGAIARESQVTGELASTVRFGTSISKRDGIVEAYVRAGPKAAKRGKKQTKEDRKGWYAGWVEFGTAAHIIRAKPGHSLAIGGGQYAQVNHPGAKKQPFMRPAMDSRSQAALDAVGEYVRNRLATQYGIDVPAPIDPDAQPDE